MYLKKVEGPRAISLPDGTIFSRADLPPSNTQRWVVARKLAVVRGVVYGLLTKAEALKRYHLSEEEFDSWVRAVKDHGESGLKATAQRHNRQP